jgi:hypothetical protein
MSREVPEPGGRRFTGREVIEEYVAGRCACRNLAVLSALNGC